MKWKKTLPRWEYVVAPVTMGLLAAALAGHYVRDEIWWPELVASVAVAVAVIVSFRIRRGGSLEEQSERAAAAVRGALAADSRYILIVCDRVDATLRSNYPPHLVEAMLRGAADSVSDDVAPGMH